ncbi:MAG TPA: class I SAM-dependent methyltransferase [Vicinamibacterales bacterium]|nr:class I SAM-dependent methyltransferase [Vicinamibacterales bacterium]
MLAARPPLCSALDPSAQPALERLHRSLQAFYNSDVTRRYFAAAESSNDEWTPAMRPQWHLKAHMPVGSSVLDLGCGSAHVIRHLADRQPAYVGVDWSQEQVTVNKQLYPRAEFVAASLYEVDFDRQFDLVISLYVIEHLVWPHRMLDRMFALTKPGGLIAIMTPPFRHREYLKSFDYGLSAIPFKDKIRQGRALDALIHTYQHRHTFPRYLRTHFPRGTDRGQFLIHLDPVCLRGAAWFPDADAVYLADTDEIGRYLVAQGATIVEHWPDWGYVLARKS